MAWPMKKALGNCFLLLLIRTTWSVKGCSIVLDQGWATMMGWGLQKSELIMGGHSGLRFCISTSIPTHAVDKALSNILLIHGPTKGGPQG